MRKIWLLRRIGTLKRNGIVIRVDEPSYKYTTYDRRVVNNIICKRRVIGTLERAKKRKLWSPEEKSSMFNAWKRYRPLLDTNVYMDVFFFKLNKSKDRYCYNCALDLCTEYDKGAIGRNRLRNNNRNNNDDNVEYVSRNAASHLVTPSEVQAYRFVEHASNVDWKWYRLEYWCANCLMSPLYHVRSPLSLFGCDTFVQLLKRNDDKFSRITFALPDAKASLSAILDTMYYNYVVRLDCEKAERDMTMAFNSYTFGRRSNGCIDTMIMMTQVFDVSWRPFLPKEYANDDDLEQHLIAFLHARHREQE